MSFYDEIVGLRKFVHNEEEIKKLQEDEKQSFIKKLLKLDEQALDIYYQQYRNKLRFCAQNNKDLFMTFIYYDRDVDKNSDPFAKGNGAILFDQVHDVIIKKFARDGIQLYKDRRGPYINGFSFRNIT